MRAMSGVGAFSFLSGGVPLRGSPIPSPGESDNVFRVGVVGLIAPFPRVVPIAPGLDADAGIMFYGQ